MVHCFAFAPDGQTVCYGGEEGRINIGAVQPGPDDTPCRIDVTALDKSWKVVETESKVARVGHQGIVRSMAVSPDGNLMASGGDDRTIRLWEYPECRPLARWEAHDNGVTVLHFLPGGRTLVSGSADGTLRLWDLAMIRRGLRAMGLDW
jgi:WD40 repeat protein